MATRKFLFMEPVKGYHQEQGPLDELSLGKITLAGVGGVAINSGGAKIVNTGAATAAGDVLVYGQAGGSLNGLTLTGDLSLGTNNATTSHVPVLGDDLANKTYVDSVAGTGVPATQIGQVLFSINGSAFTAQLPLTAPNVPSVPGSAGWLVNDLGILMVVG
jgi:hypothetical protein